MSMTANTTEHVQKTLKKDEEEMEKKVSMLNANIHLLYRWNPLLVMPSSLLRLSYEFDATRLSNVGFWPTEKSWSQLLVTSWIDRLDDGLDGLDGREDEKA